MPNKKEKGEGQRTERTGEEEESGEKRQIRGREHGGDSNTAVILIFPDRVWCGPIHRIRTGQTLEPVLGMYLN